MVGGKEGNCEKIPYLVVSQARLSPRVRVWPARLHTWGATLRTIPLAYISLTNSTPYLPVVCQGDTMEFTKIEFSKTFWHMKGIIYAIWVKWDNPDLSTNSSRKIWSKDKSLLSPTTVPRWPEGYIPLLILPSQTQISCERPFPLAHPLNTSPFPSFPLAHPLNTSSNTCTSTPLFCHTYM